MPGLVQTVAPTEEPVKPDFLRDHFRQYVDQDGKLIGIYARAARELCEEYLGQQLCTATWTYTLDRFPYRQPGQTWQWPGDVWDRQNQAWLEGVTIRLPRPPLRSISSIQYIDTQGNPQTMDPSLYLVDTQSRPGRITPVFSQIWPVTQIRINAVTITYTAGYGAAVDVPIRVKEAIGLQALDWYLNRDAQAVGELSMGIKVLLDATWHGTYY